MKSKTAVVGVMLASVSLWAQQESAVGSRNGYVTMGLVLQMWKVQPYYHPISQLSLPLALFLPVGNRYSVSLQHTPAYSWWQENQRITGLSDTWIQGNALFWGEKLLLNAGICIPTGKAKLDSVQYILSKEGLSRNIYAFRLPLYGQGFCFKGGFALAYPVHEKVVLGLGAQYLLRSSYHPVEFSYQVMGPDNAIVEKIWNEAYKPGDEISTYVGLDVRPLKTVKVSLDGYYTHYWKDFLDGNEVYGSGEKITANLNVLVQMDVRYLWMNMLYRHRGKNDILQGFNLQQEEKNSNGYQVETSWVFKAADFVNGGILFLLDGRFYGINELGYGNDNVLGGGLGITFRYQENQELEFTFKYLFGSKKTEEARNLEGLETLIRLRAEF